MKRIQCDNVIQILPAENGIVLVVGKKNIDDKVMVTYQFYSYGDHTITQVMRHVYLQAKFGEYYTNYMKSLPDFINFHCAEIGNGKLLAVYPTGKSLVINLEGKKLWEGELKYNDALPGDVLYHDGHVWVTFPQCDSVVRYNSKTMRMDLRIGSTSDGSFSHPTGISVVDGDIAVCNTDKHNIGILSPNTLEVQDGHLFEEPVYQYYKNGTNEMVLLESGVYLL